jgi:nitrous oxide reductase accessory protein NosL
MVAPGTVVVVMLKLLAGDTETDADPFAVGSAVLVAVTVTAVAALTVGAVNRPELEIWPEETDQVTPVWLVSRTAALNCWVAPETTKAVAGETVTLTLPTVPFATAIVNR